MLTAEDSLQDGYSDACARECAGFAQNHHSMLSGDISFHETLDKRERESAHESLLNKLV
jgi:hypothetical protein